MANSQGGADHTARLEVGKATLVAGLVLLVSTAMLLLTAQGELRRRNAEVARSHAALLQLAEINSLVIGVDYSARGYALTGQQLFLDHENAKQARLKQSVEELARLVEPDQLPVVRSLVKLAERQAAVYAGFVAKGPGRTKEIAEIITNPSERKKRYDVLDVLAKLHGTQEARLLSQQSAAEHQLRFTSMLTFVIVALAFLGGTLDVMARMFNRRRKRASGEVEPSLRLP